LNQPANAEPEIRAVLSRIEAAWREKRFDELPDCFDERATIVGANHTTFAVGRDACAESYREFATNASVLDYEECDHNLLQWENTAVYRFSWRMIYKRDDEPKTEAGTDQLVLSKQDGRWRVVFRYLYFVPSE